MSRVEVPDWPIPLPPASKAKIKRDNGTHRERFKEAILGNALALGMGACDTGAESTLCGLARTSTLIDELIREQIAEGRKDGFLTWAQIGAALGITKQAAQQRYGEVLGASAGTVRADTAT